MSSEPPVDAAGIARKTFPTGRRGYDTRQVAAYLQELARLVEDLTRRGAEASARADAAEARGLDLAAVDRDRLVELVGAENARALDEARAAASDIRTTAQESAARLVAAGHDEAGAIGAAAESAAAERQVELLAEAEALRADAAAELGRRRAEATEAATGIRADAEAERTRLVAAGEEARALGLGDASEARANAAAEAEAVRARATADAEATLAAAGAEAEELRSAARRDADAVRREAAHGARATRQEAFRSAEASRTAGLEDAELFLVDARAEAQHLVAEALAVREKILGDLARRRYVGRQHVERLNAARERLLSAYGTIRKTVDEATSELSVALPAARVAGDHAARRVMEQPAATIEQVEAEISAARMAGLVDEHTGASRGEVDVSALAERLGVDPGSHLSQALAESTTLATPLAPSPADGADLDGREPTLHRPPTVDPVAELAAEAEAVAEVVAELDRAAGLPPPGPTPPPAPAATAIGASAPAPGPAPAPADDVAVVGTAAADRAAPVRAGTGVGDGNVPADGLGPVRAGGPAPGDGPVGRTADAPAPGTRPPGPVPAEATLASEPAGDVGLGEPAAADGPGAGDEPLPAETRQATVTVETASPAGSAVAGAAVLGGRAASEAPPADAAVSAGPPVVPEPSAEEPSAAPGAAPEPEPGTVPPADADAEGEPIEVEVVESPSVVEVVVNARSRLDDLFARVREGTNGAPAAPTRRNGRASRSARGPVAVPDTDRGHGSAGDQEYGPDDGVLVGAVDDSHRTSWPTPGERAAARTTAARGPGSPDAPDDADLLDQRDAALAEVERTLSRRLKRVLADEENEVLDRLRRGVPEDAAEVVPDRAEHAGRYARAAIEQLEEAVQRGALLVLGADGGPTPGPSTVGETSDVTTTPGPAARPETTTATKSAKATKATKAAKPAKATKAAKAAKAGRAAAERRRHDNAVSLAEDLGESLVEPLRQRVVRSLAEGGDVDEVLARFRSLYREWKGQRVRLGVRHYAAAAYGAGALDALAAGTELRWLVDRAGEPCPDADDNALAEGVRKGQAFPTGDRCAPAHPGCRCLVVPAAGVVPP